MKQPKTKTAVIQAKIKDYKQFAFISLCVSVFLYLGAVVPAAGKTDLTTAGSILGSLAFIALSAVFFAVSAKNKKLLAEEDESSEA